MKLKCARACDEENKEIRYCDLFVAENGIKLLLYIGIASAINICWQALEILFCGALRPDEVDTIIGLTFAFAAYKLLRKTWMINRR